jgi:hypothetical protein
MGVLHRRTFPKVRNRTLETEKCPSAIENKRSCTGADLAGPLMSLPMKAGNLLVIEVEARLQAADRLPLPDS